ncbi:class I SAM-dependent methyltransferase [Mucilaginibacter antarcticus]|uniref:Class I SAM-dependent methyltransferase n=1 Tax=Mucilaginibacter antarcticus TaxID=1855725 RepID=A0ABW5XN87_9SPHI
MAKTGYKLSKLPVNLTNKADVERLKIKAQSGEAIKLHFGCGPRILKGWVNIDLSYAHYGPYMQYYTDKHYPEAIRGDRSDLYVIDILSDGLPLPDNSVDLIFHEDFFEHLTQKEQIVFLAETRRVMKNGSVHRINTPNLAASMRDNSNFEKGKAGVHIGEWESWDHYSVISPAILTDMANIVGYSSILFNSKDKSSVADQLPLEYRPNENDRAGDDSNVFADVIK